jgi:hypothetical protein
MTAVTSLLARRAMGQGRTTMRDYLDSRPVVAELEAIGRTIFFAEESGRSLPVVHVSTWRGVAIVATARARGRVRLPSPRGRSLPVDLVGLAEAVEHRIVLLSRSHTPASCHSLRRHQQS